jgi:cytochrome c554/c'-like protein
MRFWISLLLIFLALTAGAWIIFFRHPASKSRANLQGVVIDEAGPVQGASVRHQGSPHFVLSDSEGRFELPADSDRQRITASKEGFFIEGISPANSPLTLKLKRLPEKDNENYAWVDPTPNPANQRNCGNCHREIYDEWSASGHARSATNRRFLNLLEGTDWQGKSHTGWSLRDEHPDGIGVCNACHAPTAPFDANLANLRDGSAHGVHCDYCHKIANASTEHIGFTHGRYGLELLRPSQGQIFFGPLDDVDRGEDSYAALYQESRYCASCHEGVVFGVPVYTTYSEWLASPAKQEGKQCQTCHMKPTGTMSNIALGKAGIERDPQTLGNHRFFDGSQVEMLRRCLNVSAEAVPEVDSVKVKIRIQADQVGHRIPTGFVDRNLMLVVEAFGPNKSAMPLIDGPKLPSLAGTSWTGKAGKIYAKKLTDFDEKSPVPFWRAKPEIEDNRLSPGKADSLDWRFPKNTTHLQLHVIYRRFWPETAKTKGWPTDDLMIIDKDIPITR